MAKRFTDTDKWKRPWFRELPEQYRWFWIYLCDNCSAAGIWTLDFKTASHFIGQEVTQKRASELFGPKLVLVDGDKWFLPSFIEFQYGKLSAASKPHQKVIQELERYLIDPKDLSLPGRVPDRVQSTLEEEEEEEAQEEEEEEEEEEARDASSLESLYDAWVDSLAALGIQRDSIRPGEQVEILRAVKAYGFDHTLKALIGARYEKASDGWDPSQHATIYRVLFGKTKSGVFNHDKLATLAEKSASGPKWVKVPSAI